MCNRLVSSWTLAKLAGVTPQTIRNYLTTGKIQGRRLPSGVWRIEPSELEKILTPSEIKGS